jgi:hypothetical protein
MTGQFSPDNPFQFKSNKGDQLHRNLHIERGLSSCTFVSPKVIAEALEVDIEEFSHEDSILNKISK